MTDYHQKNKVPEISWCMYNKCVSLVKICIFNEYDHIFILLAI